MNKLLAALLAFAFAHFAATEGPVPDVGIEQNIGSQLPLNLPFRNDIDGADRPLGDFFRSGRPAIVVLGYYDCPHLCSVVMNGLVESLTEIRPRVGLDFDVFFISIDPSENAPLAAEKKSAYVRRYGKMDTIDGWHFLTGTEASIAPLADAIGFRYRYDPELKQFAHGSGFAIVSPTGKISRYFYGIEFPPQNIVDALGEARDEKEGSRATELLLLCYHYNPLTGPYGMIIWRTLQVAALLTLGGLGYYIVRSLRNERRAAK